jgi:hypothetical protein
MKSGKISRKVCFYFFWKIANFPKKIKTNYLLSCRCVCHKAIGRIVGVHPVLCKNMRQGAKLQGAYAKKRVFLGKILRGYKNHLQT